MYIFQFTGEKSYNRKLKEDRYKGYNPVPEHLQGTTKEEINTFLVKMHEKQKKTDMKSGKLIHSNFKCLYSTMKLDGDEELLMEEPVLTPIEKLLKDNLELLESKHKDYYLSDFGEEMRVKMLDEIKVFFMDYLKQGLQRFEMDPLNTPTSVHVTGSESQSTSKKWKKERCFKYDFLITHCIKLSLVPFFMKVTCFLHLFVLGSPPRFWMNSFDVKIQQHGSQKKCGE